MNVSRFPISRRRFSVLAGAGLAGGFGIARAQDSSRVLLGMSAPFTGPSAEQGIQFHAGAKALFDRLNAKGGVNGRQIEIRPLDDGYEPDRCAANTERLIKDDVLALFGYFGTVTSLAAFPLADAARLPFLAPLSGAPVLRQPFRRNVFHLRASYDEETARIVKDLVELNMERIGVFYQNDPYGEAGLAGVTKALAGHKLKPFATGTVERNSLDVDSAVNALAKSGAQAIVQVGLYKPCAEFIRKARKAGYAGPCYNLSPVGTTALIEELGKQAAGVMVSQVTPSPYSMSKPITRDFMDAIAAGGNKVQANYTSMEGFLAAKMFVEGLRRINGKPTREGLITALESVNEDLGGFRIKFGADNHAASSFVELSMLTADGRVRV